MSIPGCAACVQIHDRIKKGDDELGVEYITQGQPYAGLKEAQEAAIIEGQKNGLYPFLMAPTPKGNGWESVVCAGWTLKQCKDWMRQRGVTFE